LYYQPSDRGLFNFSSNRVASRGDNHDQQRWIEPGVAGRDTRIVLFGFHQGIQPRTQMNMTFWSDDVEATPRELKTKGLEFMMEPKKEGWGVAAIFKDVDGNTFVLSSK
jgi:Glyoxalase/Bleomycin resistance protein/Dioxygenase superfamily